MYLFEVQHYLLLQIARYASFETMKERTKDDPPTSNRGTYFNKDVVETEGGFFRKGVVIIK